MATGFPWDRRVSALRELRKDVAGAQKPATGRGISPIGAIHMENIETKGKKEPYELANRRQFAVRAEARCLPIPATLKLPTRWRTIARGTTAG